MNEQAGDSNLYRYVNNAPMNYGDPSGMDPWTEETALAEVNKQVKYWRRHGYDLAACLTEVMLAGEKKKIIFVGEARNTIAINAKSMIGGVVGLSLGEGEIRTGQKIKYDGQVRWQSDPDESLLGAVYHKFEPVRREDNFLFYGYGGATLKMEGQVTDIEVLS